MTKNSLKEKYLTEIREELAKEFDIKNKMAVPRMQKIIVNLGTGELLRNKESKERLVNDISQITGQKPKVQQARSSIAGFGIRQGMPVGLTVTLRGDRMYSFFAKLVGVVLPRLRDFRGVSLKSFDKAGNYTLGFSEYSVFPEVDLSKLGTPHGLEITIVTGAGSKEKGRKLLELLGMPFEKEE